MTKGHMFGLLVVAGGLASTVAVLTGERQTVSLKIWLASFVVFVAAAVLNQLHGRAPVAARSRLSMLTQAGESEDEVATRARRLRVLEGLVLRSRDNERTFTLQLQPQLVTLAEHFLRVNYGINLDKQPQAAAHTLGDVGWLVDTTTFHRTPTLEELDRFVQLLDTPTPAGEPA